MIGFFKTAPMLVSTPKALRRAIKRLEKIQDCLGRLHDQKARAEFLVSQVKSLPAGADAMIAYAAGALTDTSDNKTLLK
jgi:CHAD domain-containing protein